MENYLLISDAAKEVKVESHVLRYWEEELHLPIKRNELGHRYYTSEDVERFRQIKNMKEKGLQLKAIKMILKDGKLNVIPESEATGNDGLDDAGQEAAQLSMPINIVSSRELRPEEREKSLDMVVEESKEEKAQRLQWLLRQLIRETLQENNQDLCREIKESVVKELDYQFRTQEEREEERERLREQRSEAYYQRMDELLRKKSRNATITLGKKNKLSKEVSALQEVKTEKKKRHSIF